MNEVKITKVGSVDELIHFWPRLIFLVRTDNPSLDPVQVLKLFLFCLEFGAVFVVQTYQGLVGSCCVEQRDEYATIHSLPNDRGTGIIKPCIETIKQWALDKGLFAIIASTDRLSGSSYRYFEKTLGFHRHSVNFSLNLCQTEQQ